MVATLFVQIDGVAGDSIEKNHDKWIIVDSVDFGLARNSEQEGGVISRGFGKTVFQAIEFSSEVGKHSGPLMTASATGKVYKKIVIDQCKAGEEENTALEVYVKWTLENAMIQSYRISGSADDIPKETWSVKYGKVKFEYSETDPKTMKLTKSKEFSWDVGAGSMG